VAVGKSTTARVLQALLAPMVAAAQGRSGDDRRFPVSSMRCSSGKA